MAGSINQFVSSFAKELARPSRFDVTIPVPIPLIPYRATARNLSLRCETTELPSRSFSTADQKFGTNPIEKHAYQSNYNELTMTFIVSDDMSEKIFFDAWMELINPTTDFNMQYKNNYAVDLSINQYDVSNSLTYAAVLREAYPLAINQLDMDWSNEGYHKLAIVFAYKQWNNNTIQSLGQNLAQAAITGLVNDITSA